MKSFVQFLVEMSTADQIAAGFKALGGAARAGVSEMTEKYAQRILAGEDPNQVLAGQRPNGAVWTSVMNRVKQLQQPPATASTPPTAAPATTPAPAPAPAGPQQLSVSRLAGVSEMTEKYAQRILAGEDPNQVLAGQRPNGAVWTSVMNRVKQLQQPPATASTPPTAAPATTPAPAPAPAGPQQLSISRLENEFGIKPGRLELVDGGQYLVVKDKVTGKKEFVKKDSSLLDGVHRAIAQVFM